jgi:hypothetical protein
MIKQIILSEDQWQETYKPTLNGLVNDASCNGTLFETYGVELEAVKGYPKNKVWTLISGDEGMSICNGFHFVNREGYFLTEESWKDGEYISVDMPNEYDFCNECGKENEDITKELCNECEQSD